MCDCAWCDCGWLQAKTMHSYIWSTLVWAYSSVLLVSKDKKQFQLFQIPFNAPPPMMFGPRQWFRNLLHLYRCVRKPLQGDWRGSRDALEQRDHAWVAPPSKWEGRRNMLGIVLLEPQLQCRLEPGRAVRATEVRAGQGLLHHLAAPGPSGVPRTASVVGKGMVTWHPSS